MVPTAEFETPTLPGDNDAGVIRVLLVDDHQMVRVGLRTLLNRLPDIMVAGEAGSAEECMDIIRTLDFDVALLDVRLPGRSGLELCQEIKAVYPDRRILFLTSYFSDQFVQQAMTAGAEGYLLKEIDSDKLARSIREAFQGTLKFDPKAPDISGAGTGHGGAAGSPAGLDRLSPQEMRVIQLVSEGMTNRQIAEAMGLSEKTVKNYLSNLMEKLNISRRSQAAAFYAEHIRPPF